MSSGWPPASRSRPCRRHRGRHVRQRPSRARESAADVGLGRTDRQRCRSGCAEWPGHDLVPNGGPTRLVCHGCDVQCRPGIGLGAHGSRGIVGRAIRSCRVAGQEDRPAVPAAPDGRADALARLDDARSLGREARSPTIGLPCCEAPSKGSRSASDGHPDELGGSPSPAVVRVAGGGSTHPAWCQLSPPTSWAPAGRRRRDGSIRPGAALFGWLRRGWHHR
jgi:hypothetical protein